MKLIKILVVLLSLHNLYAFAECKDPDFIYAVKANDYDEVSRLISLKPNFYDIDCGGFSPIFWIARGNQLEMLDLIVKNGFDVNQFPSAEEGSLLLASRYEHWDMVDKMLDLGFSHLDYQSKTWKEFVLESATEKKKYDLMERLLKLGANPDLQDSLGRTALTLADYEGAKILLKYKANPYLGTTSWALGAQRNALFSAISSRDNAKVELLVQHGMDINMQDNFGYTFLHYTAYIHHSYVERIRQEVELVLRFKPDLNLRGQDGLTVLGTFKKRNHDASILKLLIDAGAVE